MIIFQCAPKFALRIQKTFGNNINCIQAQKIVACYKSHFSEDKCRECTKIATKYLEKHKCFKKKEYSFFDPLWMRDVVQLYQNAHCAFLFMVIFLLLHDYPCK